MRAAPAFALVALFAAGGTAFARADRTPEHDLAGRTPGKPVTCIHQPQIDSTTTYDNGDILYRMNGGTWYLNSPRPACPGLGSGAGLVTRTPSTDLCRGDIAEVVDFGAGLHYGACGLADFVPYARPPRPRRAQ